MKKKILIALSVALGVVLLLGVGSIVGAKLVQDSTGPKIGELNTKLIATQRELNRVNRAVQKQEEAFLKQQRAECRFGKTYENRRVGFSLTFPNDKWCLPMNDEYDPHFYEYEECSKQDTITCANFGIQSRGSQPEYISVNTRFEALEKGENNPEIVNDLIPDATVIRSDDPTGTSYQYDVFFENDGPKYIITANDKVGKNILSTLKSIPKPIVINPTPEPVILPLPLRNKVPFDFLHLRARIPLRIPSGFCFLI